MTINLPYLQLEWWVYIVVVFTFFFVILLLNYIVKKINEVRLDERFDKLFNGASTTRSVQVQRQIETTPQPPRKPLEMVLEQSNPPTLQGISMVFGQVDEPTGERMKDQIEAKMYSMTHVPEVSAGNVDTAKASDVTEAISNAPFLETIYKELSFIDKTKSFSNSVRDDVPDEMANKDATKMQRGKSTPSS